MEKISLLSLLICLIISGCEKEKSDNKQSLPELKTEALRKTGTTATFKGYIENQGSYSLTEKGFFYSSTNPLPGIDDKKIICPTTFVKDVTNLEENKHYYIRTFAVFNKTDTVYGNVVEIPKVGSNIVKISLHTEEPVINSVAGNEFVVSATLAIEGNVKIESKGFVYSHNNEQPELKEDFEVTVGYVFEKRISIQKINVNTWVRSFVTTSTDTIYGNTVIVPAFEANIYPDMELSWSEEFDYNGKPDPNKWNFETGFARNKELQWYTSDNAICENGTLVITGKKERVKNPNYNPNATGTHAWKQTREYAEYTSTSMTTNGKFNFKYGRLEVRAKIPTASGSWPAIWTVGSWYEWPFGGELDILEYYPSGGQPAIHANACWGSNKRWNGVWNSASIPFSEIKGKDTDWENNFHVWRMDWTYDEINMYLDDRLINSIDLDKTVNGSPWDLPDGKGINPFRNHPQYLFLNLAIGSNGGTPNDNAFPLFYEVDYVRYYIYK